MHVVTSDSTTPVTRQFGAMALTMKSPLEVELTRVFNAPRSLVFEACSKPEHMQRWWGPRDQTMVSCEMDFRKGGRYRFVLRKNNGREYAFRGEFLEILPPERLVQTFEFEGMPGMVTLETHTFTEMDGKTTLTVTSKVDSAEAAQGMIDSGMPTGAAETYDRLEEHLRTMA